MLTVAACATRKPTPTGATCPDVNNPQFTWDNFGSDFFCHYCTNCHDSSLALDKRNGAPLFHDLDSLIGVMEVMVHTDEQAAFGPKATTRSCRAQEPTAGARACPAVRSTRTARCRPTRSERI